MILDCFKGAFNPWEVNWKCVRAVRRTLNLSVQSVHNIILVPISSARDWSNVLVQEVNLELMTLLPELQLVSLKVHETILSIDLIEEFWHEVSIVVEVNVPTPLIETENPIHLVELLIRMMG